MQLRIVRLLLFVGLFVANTLQVDAQQFGWTRRFYFDLDRDVIRYDLRNNRVMMDSTIQVLRALMADTTVTTLRLDVTSSSSLEASDAYNSRLSARRTAAFLSELRKSVDIPYHILYVHDNIFDWDQLYHLTAASQCPERERALAIIRAVPSTAVNKQSDNQRKLKLQELAGGASYRYMMQHLFPDMRNTTVTISASHQPKPAAPAEPVVQTVQETVYRDVPVVIDETRCIFALKTNMLYDLAITPNIGVEVYVAPNVTLSANWAYAWWCGDFSSFYWRAYGGDIEARYYINNWKTCSERREHAFTGHHVGIYGMLCTYDFEFGDNGQQSAKWNYGVGIDYGYSLPLNKHLNIDFNIGFGCLYGDYYKYEPSNNHHEDYYWLSTNKRQYWGPTKAEVSLVWKLGR